MSVFNAGTLFDSWWKWAVSGRTLMSFLCSKWPGCASSVTAEIWKMKFERDVNKSHQSTAYELPATRHWNTPSLHWLQRLVTWMFWIRTSACFPKTWGDKILAASAPAYFNLWRFRGYERGPRWMNVSLAETGQFKKIVMMLAALVLEKTADWLWPISRSWNEVRVEYWVMT
jgi:hypothetical protein